MGARHSIGSSGDKMTKVSDSFTSDEICDFTAEDMNHLLFYASGGVPPLDILRFQPRDSGCIEAPINGTSGHVSHALERTNLDWI